LPALPAYQLRIDPVGLDAAVLATRLDGRVVALEQAQGELTLGAADRPGVSVVELHWEVGDPALRDVGRHVDLAATDDAHLDHRLPSRRVEAEVGRRQTGGLQLGHQHRGRPALLDPAEELPDRPEVLDVVDQRGTGQRHRERPGSALAHPVGDRQDVLGSLGLAVLDEVGLVDHHPAQAVLTEPGRVPVEDLVVDHDDVGEAVDVVAVAVDDTDGALRRPPACLTGPVGLDHVGHHDQERVGLGDLGGQERLRGLAQTRLVGQQVGPVACRHRSQEACLVVHQLKAGRKPHRRSRLGQRHARRRP